MEGPASIVPVELERAAGRTAAETECQAPAPTALDHCSGVCAIVVTFHPAWPQLERLLQSLLQQVSDVVIVDNSATSEVRDALSGQPSLRRVHLLEAGRNLGVAAAHNRGIAWADGRNHADVLLFDQDSVAGPGMVRALLSARAQLVKAGHRVAVVAPVSVDARDGRQLYLHLYRRRGLRNLTAEDADENGIIRTDAVPSSGSLISLKVIRRIGGMDEALFIDHVDTEWCLRAQARGLAAFASCRACLKSSLGDKPFRFWLGRWRYAPLHSPVRHYYMLRNSLLLIRRGYMPFGWKLYAARQALATLLFYSLFGTDRLQHWQSMSRGIRDGFKNRSGPMA